MLLSSATAVNVSAKAQVHVRVSHLTTSGPTFGNRCGAGEELFQDAEVEPHLAADPRDPNTIIAAWQQNKVRPRGAQSIRVALSTNGGRTWQKHDVPKLAECTGGESPQVSDPSVALGPDGIAYLATGGIYDHGTSIQVSRSPDGGTSWKRPIALALRQDERDHDRPSIAAGPVPGTAYTAWVDFTFEPTGFLPNVGLLMFASTTDGGRSWSVPREIAATTAYQIFLAPEIVVLANGTVLVTAIEINPSTCNIFPTPHIESNVVVLRSHDEGATWSQQTVGKFLQATALDPDDGSCFHISSYPSPTLAAQGGNVFLVWHDVRSTVDSRLLLVQSSDSGTTWSLPRPILDTDGYQAFQPMVAVDDEGRIGVTWYDLSNDELGDAALTTDTWFAFSGDKGRTWSEPTHLFGPFDYRQALNRTGDPDFPGYMLGDYFGMVPLRDGFGAVLGAAPPIAVAGESDILFTRIYPKLHVATTRQL